MYSPIILIILGTLSIKDLDDLCSRYFNGSEDAFLAELEHMLSSKAKFSVRREQIKMCAHLEQYHRGAKVLLDLKEQFNLTGDFSDMQKIMDSVSVSM